MINPYHKMLSFLRLKRLNCSNWYAKDWCAKVHQGIIKWMIVWELSCYTLGATDRGLHSKTTTLSTNRAWLAPVYTVDGHTLETLNGGKGPFRPVLLKGWSKVIFKNVGMDQWVDTGTTMFWPQKYKKPWFISFSAVLWPKRTWETQTFEERHSDMLDFFTLCWVQLLAYVLHVGHHGAVLKCLHPDFTNRSPNNRARKR